MKHLKALGVGALLGLTITGLILFTKAFPEFAMLAAGGTFLYFAGYVIVNKSNL